MIISDSTRKQLVKFVSYRNPCPFFLLRSQPRIRPVGDSAALDHETYAFYVPHGSPDISNKCLFIQPA